ncbi:MAG TPA: PLP-dependent transferase [Thermoanaerobaculia bacterium]|nr:PLP-dependent transferase [Thermoanaerobaculia bacterium]
MRIETLAVHAGGERDPVSHSVAPPLHLSTNYELGAGSEMLGGYIYVRYSNPTQERLESALAALEGGETAAVFGSGVAAGAAALQALPAGSHVIFPDDVYYQFYTMASEYLPRWGMESTIVDMSDIERVRAAVRPNTRLIWAETPSNPLLKIVDLAGVAAVAREAGASALVDSTFATPVLQRPLELGFDVVLHSTTKYMGGHGDVQGGALVFARRGPLFDAVRRIRDVQGSVASPFNSWLVLRGLRSLPCRMDRHTTNAGAVATYLASHPDVEAVHYPGLSSHPGHEVAKRQMKGFGGMLSFRLKAGADAAIAVTTRTKLFVNATSLGGPESLIEHRSSSEGPHSTTPKNLLRLSVGLENAEDLIEDLGQALA